MAFVLFFYATKSENFVQVEDREKWSVFLKPALKYEYSDF